MAKETIDYCPRADDAWLIYEIKSIKPRVLKPKKKEAEDDSKKGG
jgi:hypothetical protein